MPTASARNIVVLWLGGNTLQDQNVSVLDDHIPNLPTRDPAFQVIYTNMSNSQTIPFVGIAVLVNP